MQQDIKERLEELRRQARKAEREDRKTADELRKLVNHSAFGTLQLLLNRRIEAFSHELLTPAGGIDGLIAHEFVKGAMYGLILARDLPQVIVDSLAATTEEDSDA